MSKPILEINKYNDDTGEFEAWAIKTTAEAVETPEGKTLDIRLSEIETRLDNLAGASLTVSTTRPDNPVSGQLWFTPVDNTETQGGEQA